LYFCALNLGEVSEWPIEHAWKACLPQGNEGSNPSLSAFARRSFSVGELRSRECLSASYGGRSPQARKGRVINLTSLEFPNWFFNFIKCGQFTYLNVVMKPITLVALMILMTEFQDTKKAMFHTLQRDFLLKLLINQYFMTSIKHLNLKSI
jgi:hypothetical protein